MRLVGRRGPSVGEDRRIGEALTVPLGQTERSDRPQVSELIDVAELTAAFQTGGENGRDLVENKLSIEVPPPTFQVGDDAVVLVTTRAA